VSVGSVGPRSASSSKERSATKGNVIGVERIDTATIGNKMIGVYHVSILCINPAVALALRERIRAEVAQDKQGPKKRTSDVQHFLGLPKVFYELKRSVEDNFV
jgi:hypothetical protein